MLSFLEEHGKVPVTASGDGRWLLEKRFRADDFELRVINRATGATVASTLSPDTQQRYRIDPQKPRTEHPTRDKRVWEGIRIVEPSRPGAEVRGRFTVELDNPRGLPVEVSILNVQEGGVEPCHPEYGGARFACTALRRGPYRVQVFAGTQTPLPL